MSSVPVNLGELPKKSIPDYIEFRFKMSTGEPRSLDTADYSARATIKPSGQDTIYDRPATITDGPNGVVRYDFQAGDLDQIDMAEEPTKIQVSAFRNDGTRIHISRVATISIFETPASGESFPQPT